VASSSARFGAFLVDVALATLIAGLFTAPQLPKNWSLVAWAAIVVPATAVIGMTPGKTLFGLRVIRIDGAMFVGPFRALLRTILLFVVVPALVMNIDGRGWHDRLTATVVVRTRGARPNS
jgi:uncharacterized RDD family membrane protein YckC